MIYSNLQRYDSKGRRLSIYAKDLGNGKLSVYVQTCSTKDQFRKSYGRDLSEYYFNNGEERFHRLFPEEHPRFYTIDILNNKPKITFLNWCKDNFEKMKEVKIQVDECQKVVYRNGKVFIKTICK